MHPHLFLEALPTADIYNPLFLIFLVHLVRIVPYTSPTREETESICSLYSQQVLVMSSTKQLTNTIYVIINDIYFS
jgi:hypothetical protein